LKIVTMEQIGRSLNGISKVAVFKIIGKGFLQKNSDGKIDIDDQVNKQYLESRHADFAIFDEIIEPKKRKVKQKPVKKELKPRKKQQESIKKETPEKQKQPIQEQKPTRNPDKESLYELELKIKQETVLAKKADTVLKTLKIEELRGKLIPRDLAERYIADTIGAFSQSLISLPFAVVDNIFSIMTESPKKREDLITLLQEKYTKEMSKAAERGYKKFKRDLKERIQEQEQLERNGSEPDR